MNSIFRFLCLSVSLMGPSLQAMDDSLDKNVWHARVSRYLDVKDIAHMGAVSTGWRALAEHLFVDPQFLPEGEPYIETPYQVNSSRPRLISYFMRRDLFSTLHQPFREMWPIHIYLKGYNDGYLQSTKSIHGEEKQKKDSEFKRKYYEGIHPLMSSLYTFIDESYRPQSNQNFTAFYFPRFARLLKDSLNNKDLLAQEMFVFAHANELSGFGSTEGMYADPDNTHWPDAVEIEEPKGFFVSLFQTMVTRSYNGKTSPLIALFKRCDSYLHAKGWKSEMHCFLLGVLDNSTMISGHKSRILEYVYDQYEYLPALKSAIDVNSVEARSDAETKNKTLGYIKKIEGQSDISRWYKTDKMQGRFTFDDEKWLTTFDLNAYLLDINSKLNHTQNK